MSVETEAPKVATAVATVRVRQGEEGAFAGWLTEMNKTVATIPGYISAVVIPPVPPLQSDGVMVQRFQRLEQLRAWLDSDERRSLLDKSGSLLVDEGTTKVMQGSNTEPSLHDMVTEVITAWGVWASGRRNASIGVCGYRTGPASSPVTGCGGSYRASG